VLFFRFLFATRAGIEWRLVQSGSTQACSAYGLDLWNDWSYGPKVNEVFKGRVTVAGRAVVSIYANDRADFTWLVAETDANGKKTCVPTARQRNTDHSLTLYTNFTEGIRNPGVFTPPAICHRSVSSEVWSMLQNSDDLAAVRSFAATLPRFMQRATNNVSPAKQHQQQQQEQEQPQQQAHKQRASHPVEEMSAKPATRRSSRRGRGSN
jgi:hypothetical protein